MTHYTRANHYELLEVDPAATPAEIEEAYQRQTELLSGETIATYGLFVGDDLLGMRQRIEDAYRVLKDPVRRRAYDASGYADTSPRVPETAEGPGLGEAPSPPPPAPPIEARPAVPEAPEAAPVEAEPPAAGLPARDRQPPPPEPVPATAADAFNGPGLRTLRERNGVTLNAISARTKIAEYYLAYIEEERFDALPPAIYLRSYLRQYAAAIGADVECAVEAYLARYNDSRGRK